MLRTVFLAVCRVCLNVNDELKGRVAPTLRFSSGGKSGGKYGELGGSEGTPAPMRSVIPTLGRNQLSASLAQNSVDTQPTSNSRPADNQRASRAWSL